MSLSLVASLALAASPVGKWSGKITVKLPPMPANTPPQQKAMVTQMMGQLAKSKILANFKKDGTFTMNATGMPGPKPNDTTAGKWTQKGNAVTLTDTKNPGRPQTFIMSPNGKTMSLTMPGGRGKVVFTRA
ncbi:MAG: hypothetical protein EON57_00035 [Alphaproteobacteria bacterium]|nr:MAG: hypothetical protein EON57_00035 [Alphaproteobacteria bacterium]